MKKPRALIAVLLILSLCLSAHAESTVASLIDAAEKLAFETDNVTITGKAEFLLDGKRFKTAEITYVQDGYNSFWQEKLRTPRAWRTDLESGFTVIQNGDDIYVMETLKPGLYRRGSEEKQDALLRRTAAVDFLFALARTAAEQTEHPLGFPPVSFQTEDGGTLSMFRLRKDQLSPLANHLALLFMQLTGKRLTGIGSDDYDINDMRNGISTETADILISTKALDLTDVSVSVGTDGEGRLISVSGGVSAKLTGYSGEKRLLTVTFETALSRYGESTVQPFDPGDYQVMTEQEREAAGIEAPEKIHEPPEPPEWLEERAREVCEAAGLSMGAVTDIYFFDDFCNLDVQVDGKLYEITLSDDGTVESLEPSFYTPDFTETDEPLDGESRQRILQFLHTAHPALEIGEAKLNGRCEDEGNTILEVIILDQDGDFAARLNVCTAPEWKIIGYSCFY